MRHASLTKLLPLDGPRICFYGLLLSSFGTAQFIANLPQCWQNCITHSGDFSCSALDIPCICRLSNGNFLTDVVTCAKASCDNSLDSNLFLTPLQLACNLAGVPIAPEAIHNAEQAESTASPTSTPFTGNQITGKMQTATSTSAITLQTTNSEGESLYFIVPFTIEETTTKYGDTKTFTGFIQQTAASSRISKGTSGIDTLSMVVPTQLSTSSQAAGSLSSKRTQESTTASSRTSTATWTSTELLATSGSIIAAAKSSLTSRYSNSPYTEPTDAAPFGMQNAGSKSGKRDLLELITVFVVVVMLLNPLNL